MKQIIQISLFFILLTHPFYSFAFETDQFNLPPKELADIGDEVTEYTKEKLKKAVEKINNEILIKQSCLEKKSKCKSSDKDKLRLEFLRSAEAIISELYKLVGRGVPVTMSSHWLESHKFKNQPARFRPKFKDSIYFVFPIDYIGLGSTIKMYGAEFGTDKIAHLFQQGYDYFKIYKRGLAQGLTDEEAIKKAIKWGQKTERTYYGTLVSGVFSNADLAANYAGFKFYLGLTRENKISGDKIPPILILENGIWKFNEKADLNEHLLKPYIAENLSEAFNPSIYGKIFGLNSYVRKVLKRNCDKWKERFPNLSQTQFDERFQQTKRWVGEDYGFRESSRFITIANTCFSEKSSQPEVTK